ncbi:hypothetical protein ACTFIY_012072 [Dictyostelium cf. discoideum]
MKLFILLILLISVLLFNGINGIEYVNFIPYLNDECVGDEIGIGYSSLLSNCLPSIDSQQNYLFTLKPKNVIEWKVFKYSNKNDNNENCNLNKTIIPQPSFTTKIGSCISSEYINLDSNISISSPIYYKISITKNSPYISAKSIVNSFTFDKKCSSSSSNVLLIQYFTNHLNVKLNNKNKISYHCINDKAFTKNQFELIESITQECIQFGNGNGNGNGNGILSLIKNKFVDLRFSSGSGSGSGSGSSGGEDSSTTDNTGDSSTTGNTGESSISSSTGGNSDTSGGNSGFSSDTSGGSSSFSSTTEVTTATSATTGGATSGDDNDGTGATNFINYDYKLPNPSSTHHKIFKKTYCSKK